MDIKDSSKPKVSEVSSENADNETLNNKNIIGVAIPETDFEIRRTRLPLTLYFSDETNETAYIPYEKYFRIMNVIWNQPEYSKDAKRVTMNKKMMDASPYNLFFTTLMRCPETKEQLYSVEFTDLLCPSLGKLKESLHINWITDIKWILSQYALRNLHKLPITIIHGDRRFPWPKKETLDELYPNVKHHYVEVRKKNQKLGFHHCKLSIFVYADDSLRVVFGTANLHKTNWEVYNQQVWISPRCPKLPEGSSVRAGESKTGFKKSLLDYLYSYRKYDIHELLLWEERIKKIDFSSVKVVLMYTFPGVHYPDKNGSLLHSMGRVLSNDCKIPAPKEEHDSWRVVAQTASLGLVGRSPEEWLTTHILKALGSHKDSPYFPLSRAVSAVQFNLIYPTVRNCYDGYYGGDTAASCLYEKGVKDAQPWLNEFQCQWKADGTKRTRAMSLSKCYFRISPCWEKMVYYFLTSANLARSSWGKIPNENYSIYVRSFDTGVLFLPKYFGEEYFEVKDTPNRKNRKVFPMMFDLPLTPYGPDDEPYCDEEIDHKRMIPIDLSDFDLEAELEDDKDQATQTDENFTSSELNEGYLNYSLAGLDLIDKDNNNTADSKEKIEADVNMTLRPTTFFPSCNRNSLNL